MRKIDLLLKLQETDTEADAARTIMERLTTELGDRSALITRETELSAARDELHHQEAEQRDLELQADERRNKIATDEGKLYGGRVTNPKELTSLQEEVQQDKRQLSSVEDRLLEVLDQVESTTARVADLERTLAQETQAWEVAQKAGASQLEESQGKISRLDAERQTMLAQLTPPEQASYTSLRRSKGTAVARVHQRTCQACRVSLTPNLEQRARIGNELVGCHSCGRLLYVPLN